MKNEKDIKKITLSFSAFDKGKYKNIDLDRLILYAMSLLEEKGIPLYFDYISAGSFKLFPEKFSMATFKQYPDTNRISKALRRLVDLKRRNWSTGNIENGFFITETGKEIVIQVNELLEDPNRQKKSAVKIKKSRGKSPESNIKEIKDSEIFKKWLEKNYQMTDYEVLSFLKAVPYTPKPLLLQYLEGLKSSANTVRDKKVISFLKWLEEKFYSLFHSL